LHANVELGWRRLTLANTLAYCTVIIIAAVKSFVVLGGEKKMSDGLSKNCNEKHPTQIQKLIGHTQGLTEKVPVPSTLQYHPLTTTT
jgi:hypothetical protein